MGIFSFWGDEVSKKLEGIDKTAATMWKASNLLSTLMAFIFLAGMLVFFGIVMTPDQNAKILLFLLLLLLIFVFCFLLFIYSIFTAVLALIFKDLVWAGAILVLAFPAFAYKFWKKKEMNEKESS